jgi:hypothetical protein
MKLSYIAREKEMEIADLFYQALYQTLKDLRTLAIFKLQKVAALHGLPNSPATSPANREAKPN